MQDAFSRHIRSFVMRGRQMTDAQRTGRERLFPKWGIAYQQEPIDLHTIFGRQGPMVLEIGFGMGETTLAIAKAQPGWNILAVDVYRPGVGSLLRQIEQEEVSNIRIVEWDAVEVVRHMLPESSLDAIHIYFPDPWPKKRHHKRRLIQPEFIGLLSGRLRQNGILHLATDWPDYAQQMLEVCSTNAQLKNLGGDGFSDRPAWRPQTKFETRGLRLGHPVADLLFQKK